MKIFFKRSQLMYKNILKEFKYEKLMHQVMSNNLQYVDNGYLNNIQEIINIRDLIDKNNKLINSAKFGNQFYTLSVNNKFFSYFIRSCCKNNDKSKNINYLMNSSLSIYLRVFNIDITYIYLLINLMKRMTYYDSETNTRKTYYNELDDEFTLY